MPTNQCSSDDKLFFDEAKYMIGVGAKIIAKISNTESGVNLSDIEI